MSTRSWPSLRSVISAKVLPKYSNIEVYVDGKPYKEYHICNTSVMRKQLDNDLFHIRALCRNSHYTASCTLKLCTSVGAAMLFYVNMGTKKPPTLVWCHRCPWLLCKKVKQIYASFSHTIPNEQST